MKVLLLTASLVFLPACSGMKEFVEDYNQKQINTILEHKEFEANGDRTETVDIFTHEFEMDPEVPNQSDHSVLEVFPETAG